MGPLRFSVEHRPTKHDDLGTMTMSLTMSFKKDTAEVDTPAVRQTVCSWTNTKDLATPTPSTKCFSVLSNAVDHHTQRNQGAIHLTQLSPGAQRLGPHRRCHVASRCRSAESRPSDTTGGAREPVGAKESSVSHGGSSVPWEEPARNHEALEDADSKTCWCFSFFFPGPHEGGTSVLKRPSGDAMLSEMQGESMLRHRVAVWVSQDETMT